MNTKFITQMRCPEPDCHSDLTLIEETTTINEQVIDGLLGCENCDSHYTIKDGFPILLPEVLDDESALQELSDEELQELREVS